ncbi:MAG: hypothetical protein WCV73_03075 [Patescibacteria group bacterium]|jgi:hypothetical protein
MVFKISKHGLRNNLRDALRKCGYFGIDNSFNGKVGYVRRLSLNQHYPRFHIYLNQETDESYVFSLHLDQKKPIYQGAKAHNAEYDDEVVHIEAARVINIFESL